MAITKIPFKISNLEKLIFQPERYEVADTKTPSLRIAVYPSGVKTFLLYKKVNNVPQKIKIGRFPDLSIEQATKEAKRLLAKITLGHNPQEEKKAEKLEITFNELLEIYYQQHSLLYNKNPTHNKRMMEIHLVPIFGRSKVKNITREQICKIHTQMGINSGHGGANRVINVVSSIFNFGIRNGYVKGINPCLGLRKFPSYSRDRFLSTEELKLFFDAVEQEEELFRDFFKLLLFTGARKSNVLSMKWAHLDFNLKRWRIPETQTKNKDVNIVVLSQYALEILSGRREANSEFAIPSQYVFPGESKDGYLKDPKRAWERIKKRMKIMDIRMHDLRRTLGSYMAISGISLPIIGKALNHKSQVSTAIYARLSQNPVEDAINIATAHML
ncbi:site-specific integrase [Chitinophaga agrisoli]|uniref:Site-specific integrase n=1 Tax=Chitinophaga agrisoli TaxID=2607653 RepID=A0A5B2VTT3_9BACT|nr:site-specific integrase [Chitinophaga agrisoli]KAA2241519.1 site-specific integrase [Chitinophaga agrisoli]